MQFEIIICQLLGHLLKHLLTKHFMGMQKKFLELANIFSMKNMEIYISSFCLIWSALYIHSLETYYNISLVNSKQKCRTTKKRMRKVNDNVYYSLCCLVAAVYIRIQAPVFQIGTRDRERSENGFSLYPLCADLV